MKTMYGSVVMMAAVFVFLTTSVPAFSQMRDMSMKGHGEGHGEMMGMGSMDMMGNCLAHADKMGLTESQIMKMKPMHREMQKKQAQFMADLKIAEIDLKGIMDVKDFDLEKASAQVEKIGEIKTAHQLEMLKAMKEMRTMLTDDQFKKMQKMMPMKMGDKKPAKRVMKKNNGQ
jgi:Spy/CpxP family protein refolding chaperone